MKLRLPKRVRDTAEQIARSCVLQLREEGYQIPDAAVDDMVSQFEKDWLSNPGEQEPELAKSSMKRALWPHFKHASHSSA
jgi:hypothetical protein